MQSMTGMGRARGKAGSSTLLVEIRSINHRYCEVHPRLPSRFQSFEIPLIQVVKKKLARGKIDLSLFEEKSEKIPILPRRSLRNYFRFLKEVKKELGLSETIGLTHIQNGAPLWMARDNDHKKYGPVLFKLVGRALDDLIRMRAKEGQNLGKHIEGYLQRLEQLHKNLEERKETLVHLAKARLEKRLANLTGGLPVDEARLATEVAFLADRSDITEELGRLSSHYAQMKNLIKGKEACGRPMDFLIQEINREWNTIASKCQDVDAAHWVVAAKSELEKMREQVQNIE